MEVFEATLNIQLFYFFYYVNKFLCCFWRFLVYVGSSYLETGNNFILEYNQLVYHIVNLWFQSIAED